jgi:hypothetical protein
MQENVMCEKEVLKLIDYLYGPNKPQNEPKYKRQQDLITQARSIYGKFGEHLETELLQLLSGYAIENQTDWNYDSCFSFMVLLHEGLPYLVHNKSSQIEFVQKLSGGVYFLSLQISAMGPYYTYTFTRRTYDASLDEFDHQSSDRPFCAEHVTVLKRVVDYCERKGFRKLDKSLLERIVPGVTLELAEEEGTVTVYNCLFMDVPPESQDYAKALEPG